MVRVDVEAAARQHERVGECDEMVEHGCGVVEVLHRRRDQRHAAGVEDARRVVALHDDARQRWVSVTSRSGGNNTTGRWARVVIIASIAERAVRRRRRRRRGARHQRSSRMIIEY